MMGRQEREELMVPTFLRKRGRFTPCLQISLIRLQDLLEGYLSGPIWFSETGSCKVWNGMGEAELIALNF